MTKESIVEWASSWVHDEPPGQRQRFADALAAELKHWHKPEAITLDELIEYGKSHGANIVNGMPWSFDYKGHPVSHENDDCYIVGLPDGSLRFNRGDLLITGPKGDLYLNTSI